jgi:hypothetical protein
MIRELLFSTRSICIDYIGAYQVCQLTLGHVGDEPIEHLREILAVWLRNSSK